VAERFLRCQRRVQRVEAAQVDEELPVRETGGDLVGEVQCDRGLADPGDPVDGRDDDAARRNPVHRRGAEFAQPRHLRRAAGQHGHAVRQLPRHPALVADHGSARRWHNHRRTAGEHGISGEHELVQFAQRGTRIDPELLSQPIAQLLVHPKRVRLPATAAHREHLHLVQPLVERVPRDQRGQLAHRRRRRASLQQRRAPQLLHLESAQAEPVPFQLGQRADHTAESVPAPHRQRGVTFGKCRRVVAGRHGGTGRDSRPLEQREIEPAGPKSQHVAAPGPDEHVVQPPAGPARLQHFAEVGDVGVDVAVRRSWRVLPPQRVRQLITGDHRVRAQRQRGEQRPRTGRPKVQVHTVDRRRDAAEQANYKPHSSVHHRDAPVSSHRSTWTESHRSYLRNTPDPPLSSFRSNCHTSRLRASTATAAAPDVGGS